MGCGQSTANKAEAPTPRGSPSVNESHKNLLEHPKWRMLMDWTGWHEVDQFGWHQPSLAQLVGPSGRSKLSGVERPYNYQASSGNPERLHAACARKQASTQDIWVTRNSSSRLRLHPLVIYPQVSISFPGADFDKGSGGQYAALSDHTGKHLASSGTEMAEAIQSWLTEGWLDGDEMRGSLGAWSPTFRSLHATRCLCCLNHDVFSCKN
eukprot:676924-Pelagomonas_calceolata.AAC.1